MDHPSEPGHEFNRALTHIAGYLSAVAGLALMMSLAYEIAKAHSLDPNFDVVGNFTWDDLLLAVRHWLPMQLAYGLLGGGIVFLLARRRLSGLALWALVLGYYIGTDLTWRLLPKHFSAPFGGFDYVLLPVGFAAAAYLLIFHGAPWLTAQRLIAAAGVGLVCTAGEAGVQAAPAVAFQVIVNTLDPDIRACQIETLQQGGRLMLGYVKQDQRQRLWYAPADGKPPQCKGP